MQNIRVGRVPGTASELMFSVLARQNAQASWQYSSLLIISLVTF